MHLQVALYRTQEWLIERARHGLAHSEHQVRALLLICITPLPHAAPSPSSHGLAHSEHQDRTSDYLHDYADAGGCHLPIPADLFLSLDVSSPPGRSLTPTTTHHHHYAFLPAVLALVRRQDTAYIELQQIARTVQVRPSVHPSIRPSVAVCRLSLPRRCCRHVATALSLAC